MLTIYLPPMLRLTPLRGVASSSVAEGVDWVLISRGIRRVRRGANNFPRQVKKMVHSGLLVHDHAVGHDEQQSGRVCKCHHVGDDGKKVCHSHKCREHDHGGRLKRHGKHHAHAYSRQSPTIPHFISTMLLVLLKHPGS
ncbi:hypothetical protein FIBSPDRAFT_109115 [Athelia psychrophila]|uniref:Uncharacterized protein n=1 Tax=Athelia psychrophila TaxID=1759441 RepID=A0A166TCP7_9AGAM|nr:hypothetical protein FIBSPDRAFT_109115 [Fibularhizoctonia sp. CBS 109695]